MKIFIPIICSLLFGDTLHAASVVLVTSNQTFAELSDHVRFTCQYDSDSDMRTQDWVKSQSSTEDCVQTSFPQGDLDNPFCTYNNELCSLVDYSECDDGFTENITISVTTDSFGEWICKLLFENDEKASQNTNLLEYKAAEVIIDGMDFVLERSHIFTCSATNGDPQPTEVSWTFNEEPRRSCPGSTCELELNIDRSMIGQEICCSTFQLPYKSNTSTCKTLDVLYPPDRASISSNGPILVGESITLTCTVTEHGNPPAYTYVWSRDGDNWTLESEEESLTFILDTECYTTYYCTPRNDAGDGAIAQTQLSIEVKPSVVNSHSRTLSIFNENNLSVNCTISGKPSPTAKWVYDREGLTQDDFMTWQEGCDQKYYSEVHLIWNTGNYEERKNANGIEIHCTGENEHGFIESQISTLNVEYAPGKADISSSKNPVDVETDAIFICSLPDDNKGNPESEQFCFKDGSSELGCVDDGNTKRLTMASVLQEGPYSCYGSNQPTDAERQYGYLSEPENLVVLVPAEVLNPTDIINLDPKYEDENFVISCTAFGKPQPEMKLFKDGAEVNDDDFIIETTAITVDGRYDLNEGIQLTGTLALTSALQTCESITYYDGTYQCRATNVDPDGEPRHHWSANIQVATRYTPLWNGSEDFVQYAELYANNFSIVCDICSNPFPQPTSYMWWKKDVLQENQNKKIYRIPLVGRDDYTLYTCQADNGIDGPKYFTLQLVEKGPPWIYELNITERTSMSLTVSWAYMYTTRENPPVSFSILYEDHAKGITSIHKTDITDEENCITETVTGLKAANLYTIIVIGENTHLVSSEAQNNVTGSTREEPDVSDIEAELIGSTVIVKWNYYQPPSSKTSSAYKVTVQAEYYHKDTPDDVKLNPLIPLSADAEELAFTDPSVTGNHLLTLVMYENGIRNENAVQEPVKVSRPQDSLSAGAITGILLLCLVVVLAACVAFLLYTKRLQNPFSSEPQSNSIRSNLGGNKTDFDNLSYNREEIQDENKEETAYAELDEMTSETRRQERKDPSVYTQLVNNKNNAEDVNTTYANVTESGDKPVETKDNASDEYEIPVVSRSDLPENNQ